MCLVEAKSLVTMDEAERKKLIRLVRKVARETAWEVIDEHIEEYEHKEKLAKDYEVENQRN